MSFSATPISYKDTRSFSRLILDYLAGDKNLSPFYTYAPDAGGVEMATRDRNNFNVDRALLVNVLCKQYEALPEYPEVKRNIDNLSLANCYTVCTAHQPNIFTGHLYFIYKIFHAIRLAETLKKDHPTYEFVPVYYMGSEDADLEELGQVELYQKSFTWKTKQSGAVGRMMIDKPFTKLIQELESALTVEKYGDEIIGLVKSCYRDGISIEAATQKFVHALFGQYGLVILMPDDAELKGSFAPVMQKELETKFSRAIVDKTIGEMPEAYKIQAAGRDINLFYLKDNIRERIVEDGAGFIIANSDIAFTKGEMSAELKNHPERFSPNVILRPLYQEFILPNVAFIGGGGELAYWLELKDLFEEAGVFFPALILRNSFMLVMQKQSAKLNSLGLPFSSIFVSAEALVNNYVRENTANQLLLTDEKISLAKLYSAFSEKAEKVDSSLGKHVVNLQAKALKKIDGLEKKMLKAEKEKFEAAERQIIKIKSALFPGGTLQERKDNILYWYAVFGPAILEEIYNHSSALEQHFKVLEDVDG
ncbi:MAG: bacillithiol biosynthesis cysteine-adding enzyme BshC [Ferruginibacter sp.]